MQETNAALARQFANRCDSGINNISDEQDVPNVRANFRDDLLLTVVKGRLNLAVSTRSWAS